MRGRIQSPFARPLVLAFSLVSACTVGSCGKTAPSRGGLMLVISTDGPLEIGRLEIQVKSKGQDLFNNPNRRVPEEITLPGTVAIVSNGDATASAEISVTGWQLVPGKDDVPLDRRDAIVTQIPVDRVAELSIVLSARCMGKVMLNDGKAVSTCEDGETCDHLTGDCKDANVSATTLAPYPGNEHGAGAGGASSGGVGGSNAGWAGATHGGAGSMLGDAGAGGDAGEGGSAGGAELGGGGPSSSGGPSGGSPAYPSCVLDSSKLDQCKLQ